MKTTLLLILSILATGATLISCDEIGDDDHPGMPSSNDAVPAPKIDGRQEKLVPGSRNDPAEGRED